MTVTLLLCLTAAIAYALGNFNGAIITSGRMFKRDIRNSGSGNAGLANFYRTFGLQGILVVIAVDFGKGFIATLLGGFIMSFAGEGEYLVNIGKMFAAFCAVMGHIFPVMYGFKGGKGVLTGFAGIIAVDWRIGLICFAVWLICLVSTRYISLGSMMAPVALPIALLGFDYGVTAFWLGMATAFIIVIKHRANMVRIAKKEEPKFELKRNVSKRLDEDIN